MNTELIIRSNSSDIDFALLKEGRLIELHQDSNENKFSVGDVFLAKVKKTLTGINASFINVGSEKDAFLHYLDLGPQFLTLSAYLKQLRAGKEMEYTLKNFPFKEDINKEGKIDDVLKSKQLILTQVVKEPISTKGPRLSAEISIAGRYLVLVPFSNRVSVSQKITSKTEKERLKRLVKSIKPKGFGVILRTVAQDIKVAELDKDLQNSLNRWKTLCKSLTNQNVNVPVKVLSELNRASSILRDIFNDSFTKILTDDKVLAKELKEYITEIAPNKASIVQYYSNTETPIFEKFNIERQIKTSFGKTVSMKKGAYLVIEHTEALHVIDVNSGNRSSKTNSQAETALEVNLIAATEVARQLQLRDMGGIIVVDFIDMRVAEHKNRLFEHFKNQMKSNRTKYKILPLTKFGLMQITRQRVRQERVIQTKEQNPNTDGKVEAPVVVLDKIINKVEQIILTNKSEKVLLHVHPFIAAYLQKGLPSIQHKWFLKHKKWIKIVPRDGFTFLHYKFVDSKGKTFRL